MRTLVIDDRRMFDHARDLDFSGRVVYARSLRDGLCELLLHGPWDVVYLDHDLGFGPTQVAEDIRALVTCLAELRLGGALDKTQFHSCSSNYAGRKWTVDTLRDAGYNADEKEPKCRLHRF